MANSKQKDNKWTKSLTTNLKTTTKMWAPEPVELNDIDFYSTKDQSFDRYFDHRADLCRQPGKLAIDDIGIVL